MTINTNAALCGLALLILTLTAGCAPAYHGYSGCYVDCKYGPPPPLPYACYPGCVCHSCAADEYLSIEPPVAEHEFAAPIGTPTD